MIKYKLICKSCDTTFDSWFASSKEYEKLKKNKYLNCHECGSIKVEKTLMAPKLFVKRNSPNNKLDLNKHNEVKNKILEYQKFIKNNFDYVGENFAYEARSIHYNHKKRAKGIYGTASQIDLKELKEEGIEAQMIPWIKDRNN
ncbi:MAG: DUF1178 family protein [Pelagibacteraceae bacterium]|nr:DUF1178 family protein [Pelagibacteraceae bacterium]PHX88935.1 MAG: hypothetical protein CK535_04205 [Pelagibacteraceae bacterium]